MRYPNIRVQIHEERPSGYDEEDVGTHSVKNSDATRILERVQNALREGGVSDKEIEAYTREATRRCYNHLLFTTMTWVSMDWYAPDYDTGEI